ncbi:MAG: hypothetical protein QOI98_3470, partial [Solirubrobacteraceae bacterium]|nr:hypothetical protein [Solirubrobacteraceae bacterium]
MAVSAAVDQSSPFYVAVEGVSPSPGPNWRLVGYAGLVSLAGLGALAWLVSNELRQPAPSDRGTLALVAALLVVGMLFPIAMERHGEREAVDISGVFACALLLRWDPAFAVLMQAVAALLHGAVHRVTWWKRIFNVAQYTLALTAAAWAFHRFAASMPPTEVNRDEFIGALAAAGAFFLANHALTGVAFALIDKVPVISSLIADLGFQASINGLAATSAPLVLVAADANPWLVVVLLLPLAAVHRSANLSLRNDHQARHDSLTGLPNGGRFRQLLESALTEGAHDDRAVAVVMIDIDDFTEVNNTLGHHVGDLVLRQMADRLHDTLGDAGTVARFGGDEFSLLLPSLRSPLEAAQLAERVLRDLETPFEVEGSGLDLKASLGLALYPQHGDDVDVLIQRADVALNVAKKNRAGLEIYSSERDQHSRRRLAMFGELRQAMVSHQLTMRYQPKADLRTGRLVGVESLVRWQHPTLGVILPTEFIALAEHTGLIRQLTEYVLEETAKQSQAWRSARLDLPISVNLSAKDLHDSSLPNKVARLLAIWGIPSEFLVVEVTETALMSEPERAVDVLDELHELRIRISMDDFGTGYSSLTQLKRLPVDEIKIDRSFITNLETDKNDQIIVRSTIELARNLGLEVVAEGVETQGAWNLLSD